VTFWSAWDGADLLGCGALKQLDPSSMARSSRCAPIGERLRRGTGAALVSHILGLPARGYQAAEPGDRVGARLRGGARALSAVRLHRADRSATIQEDPFSRFMSRVL
jgi:putative acetyltransferase